MFDFFKKRKDRRKKKVNPDEYELESPGWGAINSKLAELYGSNQPDLHLATIIKYILGGPDPLDGISGYIRHDPKPHIHYISYGFSELYAKETEDLENSGYGFELTFRLAIDPDSLPIDRDSIPRWPAALMQFYARYVFETGKVFINGQFMNVQKPINTNDENAEPTEMQGNIFCTDPELGIIETCHGRVEFLQIVGATESELNSLTAKEFVGRELADKIKPNNPLLITDIKRTGSAMA